VLQQNRLNQFLDRLNRFWAVCLAVAAAFSLLSPLLLVSHLSFFPAADAFSSLSLSPPHLKYFQNPLKSLQNSWRKVVDSILSSSSTSSPRNFRIFVEVFSDQGIFISSLSFDSIYAFVEYLEIIFKEIV
jgi:predicted PurR-regulated permease PerM